MIDPWHFPRRDLADRTLTALTDGPSKALTLFAPRRRGKTEFLLKDVRPAAEKAGHRVIYVSFWDPLEPLALLVSVLESATARSTAAGRAGAFASRMTPKIKLSASIPGTDTKGEIDLTQIPKKAEKGLIAHVDTLLGKLARSKKKTILLLDEIQELAKRKDDAGLVAALRTSLDVRSDGLRTIFTGSSREGLQKMFASSKAPFFHFGAQIELPDLGDEFVDHMLKQAARITKMSLDRREALPVFEAVGRSPYHFRGLIESLVLNPALKLGDALEMYRERLAEEQGFARRWLTYKPLQRAILAAISRNQKKLYSDAVSAEIADAVGRDVPNSSIQRAVQSLLADGVVDRWDGDLHFSDEEFRIWVATRN